MAWRTALRWSQPLVHAEGQRAVGPAANTDNSSTQKTLMDSPGSHGLPGISWTPRDLMDSPGSHGLPGIS
eukprot:gene15145-biopygen17156